MRSIATAYTLPRQCGIAASEQRSVAATSHMRLVRPPPRDGQFGSLIKTVSTTTVSRVGVPSTVDAATIRALASAERLALVEDEVEAIVEAVNAVLSGALGAEQLLGTPAPAVKRAYRHPLESEDPFNAFISMCDVAGAESGALTGVRVGLKDNIALAGVPTTNGSRLTPFIPAYDAAVVARLLDAGARIVGKLNMDDFGAGGTSELSAFGPTSNPHNEAYCAGGSSSGCGAALAAGQVDLALGVDQGGSGRIPAACCGLVALKATHGAIPTHGVTHIDHTLDHVTPMAATVQQVAVAFDVLAGPDERDPQWMAREHYSRPAPRGRVAAILESIPPRCHPAVRQAFEATLARLGARGWHVEWISLPAWNHAQLIFNPYVAHVMANMVRSEGTGYGHLGEIDRDETLHYARARSEGSVDVVPQVKAWMLAERYLRKHYGNGTYATLQTLRRRVRAELTGLARRYEALLTPTLLCTAPRLLDSPTVGQLLGRDAQLLTANVVQPNLTGHPAVTLPNGSDHNGLPTAVQLIGSHGGDVGLLATARQFERALADG